MKHQDLQKYREQPISELKSEVGKRESKLVESKMKRELGQLKNVREYKMVRQEIAQLKTIIRIKELSE
jgi:ribosomal protein L29